jgi:cytochrome o ubiquinol oxidase subunit 2
MPVQLPRLATLLKRASPVMAALVGGCLHGPSPLNPAGPIAAANKQILLDSLGVMLLIVVPTIIATLSFAWWYRADNPRATYRPDFTFSGRIEVIVWSIPILTVMFLSGLIWIGTHSLDPYKPLPLKPGQRALEVQVVSLDWKWLFIYPQYGVASVNQLMMPLGRPVHFSMTSASVMNVFFIPQLGSQVYTMNGMVSHVHLQADRPGT